MSLINMKINKNVIAKIREMSQKRFLINPKTHAYTS